jgi:hypothetical protein
MAERRPRDFGVVLPFQEMAVAAHIEAQGFGGYPMIRSRRPAPARLPSHALRNGLHLTGELSSQHNKM